METSKRPMPPAAIAAGVGGLLLALGSVLTWATASVDVDKLARAVGIDPSQIPPGALGDTSRSFAGTSGTDGKVTLVCGIVVILGAIGIALAMGSRRVLAILTAIAGAIGGLFALYDATIAKNNAIDDITRQFSATGLPGNARDFFSVSLGIGIWMCVIGGIVAVVGAVMALASGEPSAAAPAYPMAGMGSGFGTTTGTGVPTTAPAAGAASTWGSPAPAPPPTPSPAAPPADAEPEPTSTPPAPPEPPA